MKCSCCGDDDILRDRDIIKQFKSCDHWYCNKCIVYTDNKDKEKDNVLSIVKQVNETLNFEHYWILQLFWDNENQWKSAKIQSIDNMKEITITYLENEMEDTINIDENEMILRFITNPSKPRKKCKILVWYTIKQKYKKYFP